MIRIVNGEIVRDAAPDSDDGNRSSRRSTHPDASNQGVPPQGPHMDRSTSFFDQLEEPMPVFGHLVAKKWLVLIGFALMFGGGIQLVFLFALFIYFASRHNPAPIEGAAPTTFWGRVGHFFRTMLAPSAAPIPQQPQTPSHPSPTQSRQYLSPLGRIPRFGHGRSPSGGYILGDGTLQPAQ